MKYPLIEHVLEEIKDNFPTERIECLTYERRAKNILAFMEEKMGGEIIVDTE